jgi:hypothetical protein
MKRVVEMQTHPATHTIEEYQKFKSLHWLGQVKLLLGLILPSPSYMRRRYGSKTNWTLTLWYPYRWLGIIVDVLKTGWISAVGSRR